MNPDGESSPRLLTAGPLSCWLVGADLRQITVDGVEVVQRLYAAVRDAHWGTVRTRVLRQDLSQNADGFRVTTEVEYREGQIHHIAQVVHTATADGTLDMTYVSEARSAFSSMRIGLCVHHPQQLAGTQALVAHHDGSTHNVLIPLDLSSGQPARDIRALETEIEGARIRLGFSGTVFEMEDQRNYGDASFKTYCTPLEWPAPVAVVPGDHVEHGLTLRVMSRPSVPRTTASVTRLHIGDHLQPRARVGQLGPHARHGHVLLKLEIHGDWKAQLASAEFNRSRDGLPVLVAVAAETVTESRARALAAVLPPDSDVLVLDGAAASDCTAAVALLRAVLPPEVRLGSGSRQQFYEVNCGVAAGHVIAGDLLSFTINPLVHADDDWSLFENTAAYSEIVASARKWGRPLHIGPLGLPDSDPRQATERGAAWLTAALAYLLPTLTANDALTLGAPTAAKTPSEALLDALAETTGQLPVSRNQANGIVAFAAARKDGKNVKRVFIANTSHLPAAVLVSGLRQGGEALRLAPWAMTILDG